MKKLIRKLSNEDFQAFDDFLKNYTETSMFMRSNARRAGLVFEKGKDYSAEYMGTFINDKIVGVLALNWNGNLMIQSPNKDILFQLLGFAAQTNPLFTIRGILGPDDQARQILEWLHVDEKNLLMSAEEISYSLNIDKMAVPKNLSEGLWQCRLAVPADLPILGPWRVEYDKEALNLNPPDALSLAENETLHKIALGEIFVLEVQGKLVSRADYNATLPEVYQIGGVWTPPDLRGRGYARAATAGAILAAKSNGVKKAVLFTNNTIAIKCYESLGFTAVSKYHLSFLKEAIVLGKGLD